MFEIGESNIIEDDQCSNYTFSFHNRSLYHAKNGAELARETFLKHKTFYHPIAAGMIAKDLGLAK